MRIPAFEFEDFNWFPDFLRRGMMDYLRYFFTITRYYLPASELLYQTLKNSRTKSIVDLCSGGGGPVLQIQQELLEKFHIETTVSLTDLYPNRDSCRFNKKNSPAKVVCIGEAVDATLVPKNLKGVRTIFSSIHHFDPRQVQTILEDAVRKRQGIAVFDIGDQNLLAILGLVILHPIMILLLTPFFRPFRLSTIIFTYLIPLIPLFSVWDGIMSILRLYDPEELLTIASKVESGRYHWRSGKVRNGLGLQVTYLIGLQKDSNY